MVDNHLRSIQELIPENDIQYIGSLAIIGYVYSGIVFISSIGFGVWTQRNRRTRVVKSAQPIFLLLICIGTFIASSSMIPMTFDDGNTSQQGADIACMSVSWLAWPGFVLVYAALFSKTWRANKVINSANRFKRVKVTAMDVMVPLLVLMTSVIILLACWTVQSPVYFHRENRGYGMCITDQPAYYYVVLSLFNVTFIITGIQAFRARKIDAEFSESRYIGIIIGISIVLSAVQGVLVAQRSGKVNFVTSISVVFLNCMLVLLLIFVPKIVSLQRWRRDQEVETQKQPCVGGTPGKIEQPTSDEPGTGSGSSDLSHKGSQHSDTSHESTHDLTDVVQV